MKTSFEFQKLAVYDTQNCMVIPIQSELSGPEAKFIQENILLNLSSRNSKGVIIDLSGVNIVDSSLWNVFINTISMIKMLGRSAIITGLQPGAVASIIDSNIDIKGIETTLTLEIGLRILNDKWELEATEKINPFFN